MLYHGATATPHHSELTSHLDRAFLDRDAFLNLQVEGPPFTFVWFFFDYTICIHVCKKSSVKWIVVLDIKVTQPKTKLQP